MCPVKPFLTISHTPKSVYNLCICREPHCFVSQLKFTKTARTVAWPRSPNHKKQNQTRQTVASQQAATSWHVCTRSRLFVRAAVTRERCCVHACLACTCPLGRVFCVRCEMCVICLMELFLSMWRTAGEVVAQFGWQIPRIYMECILQFKFPFQYFVNHL